MKRRTPLKRATVSLLPVHPPAKASVILLALVLALAPLPPSPVRGFLSPSAKFGARRCGTPLFIKKRYKAKRDKSTGEILNVEKVRRRKTPADAFDLGDIEAFEKQLLRQEAEAEAGARAEDEPSPPSPDPPVEEDAGKWTSTEFEVFSHGLDDVRMDVAVQTLLSRWCDDDSFYSRQTALALLAAGRVFLLVKGDASRTPRVTKKKGARLEDGQTVVLALPSSPAEAEGDPVLAFDSSEQESDIVPEDLPLDILYEDTEMLVVNKAPGMVVHPASSGHTTGTLVHAVAYHVLHRSEHGRGDYHGAFEPDALDPERLRPGIVHRLDKGTSGIIVVAKTRRAHARLCDAFKARRVSKTYLAVTVGDPGREVIIDKPIGRHPVHRYVTPLPL